MTISLGLEPDCILHARNGTFLPPPSHWRLQNGVPGKLEILRNDAREKLLQQEGRMDQNCQSNLDPTLNVSRVSSKVVLLNHELWSTLAQTLWSAFICPSCKAYGGIFVFFIIHLHPIFQRKDACDCCKKVTGLLSQIPTIRLCVQR